ncbi:MAG: hypothetical protein L0Z62_47035 [Gemmataceae bacterium]|nr:hypothetical protein [Gemmataceae bacterium]
MIPSPSPNGQHNGRLYLAAVLCLGCNTVLATGGVILLAALGAPVPPGLAALAALGAGWLAGLLTPRPR